MRTFAELYVIVACLCGWGAVSWWGIINLRLHYKSIFYKAVTAVVTNVSTATERWSSYDLGWEILRLTHYSYRFQVDGRKFHGNTRDDFFGTFSAVAEGALHEGDEVTVFYDPEDRKNNWGSKTGLYAGLFVIVLAQGILAIAIKQTVEFVDSRPAAEEIVSTDFPLAGHWYGYIEDPRIGSYNASLTLYNDSVGELSGRVRYYVLNCATALHFESVVAERYRYRENYEHGTCKGNGIITLESDGVGGIKWLSSPADEERTFKGVFQRAEK